MKVIVNKYIPFHGFISMMLYGIMFWRKEYEYKMNDKEYFDIVYNHESIHEAQMKDFCKFIPIGGTIFYIVYLLEWLFKVLFVYPFSYKTYSNISFEIEANNNENNMNYLKTRKKFAQWK